MARRLKDKKLKLLLVSAAVPVLFMIISLAFDSNPAFWMAIGQMVFILIGVVGLIILTCIRIVKPARDE